MLAKSRAQTRKKDTQAHIIGYGLLLIHALDVGWCSGKLLNYCRGCLLEVSFTHWKGNGCFFHH